MIETIMNAVEDTTGESPERRVDDHPTPNQTELRYTDDLDVDQLQKIVDRVVVEGWSAVVTERTSDDRHGQYVAIHVVDERPEDT